MRLRPEPQFQSVIDAREIPLARADHPVPQSASADGNASALEGLRQAVERSAVDIFVNKRKGQRRGRGNAPRQGLRGHWCNDNRRLDTGSVTMAAGIFEPDILQDLRLYLDVELLGDGFSRGEPLFVLLADSKLMSPVWVLLVRSKSGDVLRVATDTSPLFQKLTSIRQVYQVARLSGLKSLKVPVDC